jgi:putative inorganic carbon (HCO3(-)) transporter
MANSTWNASSTQFVRSKQFSWVLVVFGMALTLATSVLIGATDYGFLAFGGVLALVGAIVILLRPQLGLYLLIVFVYANLSDVLEVTFGIPSTNKFLVGLIFVGMLANRVVLQDKPFIFRVIEISILAYGVALLVSSLVSPYASDSISLMIDWFKDFAIMLIIIQLSTEEKVWKRAQWALILIAAFLAALSFYQILSGNFTNNFFGLANAPVHEVTEGFDSNRVTGPIDDPNFYGMALLMTLPIAVYRFMTETAPRLRLLALAVSLMILSGVLFTYSRGAFVSLIITGILIVRERKLNPYKIAFGVGALLIVLSPILPAGFTSRLLTLGDILPGDLRLQTESSFRGRSSEAIVALRMFQDYPLLGVGRGNYALNYLDYSSRLGLDDRLEQRQAHSLYLELAAETGIVGITVFSIMQITLFVSVQRAKKRLGSSQRSDLIPWVNGIQYGLIAYLLASLFLHADYIRYFWLIVGLTASCSVIANSQDTPSSEEETVPDLLSTEVTDYETSIQTA